MQILIISGFLGAGKTRFITELVKKTGKRFAIVENEFSEVDLDSRTILEDTRDSAEKVAEGLRIWELTEGCICCSTSLDFTQSVLTIANTVNPDYLIIEPSGVGLPSRILAKLRTICYEQISLLAPITIVDGTIYQQSRKDFSRYFRDQVNHAGTVVISKSENFSILDFNRIAQDLSLPSDVDFPTTHYANWTPAQWEQLLHKEFIIDTTQPLGINLDPRQAGKRFRVQPLEKVKPLENMAIYDAQLTSADQLVACLEIIIRQACGRVVRAKGYLQTATGFLRFDVVDGQYSITEFAQAEDQRIAIIGENLQPQLLRELFGSTHC